MALARHMLRLPDSIRSQAPAVKRWSQRIRSRHLFVADLFGLLLAVTVALAAWQSSLPGEAQYGAYFWIVGITICSQVAASILLGLYTNSWRYASVGDMGRVLACAFAGTTAAILIVLSVSLLVPSTRSSVPPPAFWLIEATLSLGVLATPRFLIRAASDLSDRLLEDHEQERTLLYGAGWAGVMVARSAERSPDSGVAPVGFLDDNDDLKGRRVAGLTVYGSVKDMGRAKRLTGATTVLITMPRAEGPNVRRVVEAAMAHDLDVRTVPAMTDLIDGTIDASHTRKVRVEDLLRRPLATEHSPALQRLLEGSTVMVTGAAGSIGSELVRQVLAVKPRHIVMVDQAESAMYMVARHLETRPQVQAGVTSVTTHLVDVTDREAMFRLMWETRPVVVFHAAAYKHVPMLEEHAAQAVRVNVGGTLSVVDAAQACGVDRFVLVSTDKAVRPSSVMGATKRIAEMIVSAASKSGERRYVSVRFGNVLGSNGSVVPVFQSQLENGQPLTLTHPEMTRYFMTIPEASWLILDAAALSDTGGLYVLDMGEPVRILDVARDLIRLSGRDPDTVPIRTIGLRPGEKLHEELFYDTENVGPTEVAKVLRSNTDTPVPGGFLADLEHLMSLARNGQDAAAREGVMHYVKSSPARPPVAIPVGQVEPVAAVDPRRNGTSGKAAGAVKVNGRASAASGFGRSGGRVATPPAAMAPNAAPDTRAEPSAEGSWIR